MIKFNHNYQSSKIGIDALKPFLSDRHKTVPALLVALCGDFVAGHMLYHLLHKFPRASREDGSVWLPAEQWLTECGLTEKQVKRAKTKMVGIRTAVLPHKYGRATHYYLDIRALIRALASLLKASALSVLHRLKTAILADRSIPTSPTGQSQTSRPFNSTYTVQKQNNDDDVKSVLSEPKENLLDGGHDTPVQATSSYVELREAGLTEPNLSRCAYFDISRVRTVIEASQKLASRNRPGWIADALTNRWEITPPPPPSPRQHAFAQVDPSPASSTAELDIPTEPDATVATIWDDADLPLPVAPAVGSPAWVWSGSKDQLKYQLDQQTFDALVARVEFVSFADGRYNLSTPNPYACDMLQNRLYRNLRRTLSDIHGSPVEITFTVKEVAHA